MSTEDRDDLNTENDDEDIVNTPDPDLSADDDEEDELDQERERMRQALAKANKEAKQRRLQLKRLEEAGLDVDKAVELAKSRKDEEQKRALRRGDVDKIKAQLEEQYLDDIKSARAEVEKMQKALYENLVVNKASEALIQQGATKGAPKVLNPHIKQYAQVQEEDGAYHVRIIDDDGDVRFNKNGDYMSISDYVMELKADEDYGRMFEISESSGTGSKPASTGSKKSDRGAAKPRSKMTAAEKAAYIHAYGSAARKDPSVPAFSELPR